jgi:hypothetical protein
MGLKETDNYSTGRDGGDRSKLPRLGRSIGSTLHNWVEDMRGGDGEESSWFNCMRRLGRSGKEMVDEVPGFARAVAAGSMKHLIILMLLVLCAFSIVHWVVLKDAANLNANMVPAPALCASQDDMYDTATRRCQVGNKYAFWYLQHKDWVQCAPNLPGFSLLQQSVDTNGNYWYRFENSKTVRNFYDTCIPECATDEDTFHSSKDMCLATDQVLLSFLSGDGGGTCAKGTLGEKAIRTATETVPGARQYWYAPDASVKVRRLLESCHAQCAGGDLPLPQDPNHCQVINLVGIEYLIQGNKGTRQCDPSLPGRRYITHMGTTSRTKAAFQYPKMFGTAVQQFYLSCYQGYGMKGKAVARGLPHSAETIKGMSLRDYQRHQKRTKV